jgi:CheY-like chemotaxis protein
MKYILLVEDEPLIAYSEKKQLEGRDYVVFHVATGEQAVDAVVEGIHPVDLVLMDIKLGHGIDGIEAARRITAHTDIPVVFLSSHTEPEIVEQTEKVTSYGYVLKNSGIVVLNASIKMALKLFEARMERKKAEQNATERHRTGTFSEQGV